MHGRTSVAALVAALSLGLGACVYDRGERCGPGQTYDGSEAVCVCDEGTVIAADGDGCEPCGDNEVVEGGACVCEEGHARSSDSAPCEMIAAGLGDACDPDATTPCTDDDFSFCAEGDGGDAYCTRPDCGDDGDCPADHVCDDRGDTRFCKAPPWGRGNSCEAEDDCVDFTASYCETLFIRMCLVEGCADGGEACHGDWACCDFRDLAGVSLCVPPEQLDGDACPLGVPRLEAEP